MCTSTYVYSLILFAIKQKDQETIHQHQVYIIVVFGIIIGAQFQNDKALDEKFIYPQRRFVNELKN